MPRALFFTFFFLFSSYLFAQNILVLQAGTSEPIPGVAVFNQDGSKSGITNLNGFVDISKFDEDERINFQHISHDDISLIKSDILKQGPVVRLRITASALEEIVLSVSKFGQKEKEIPQQIVSVNSEDVLFSNPQTAADLLESSGQVFVQKSQLGGGSPLIRGFSTNRLLIAVDGVRFNNAIFRGGNVQNVISIDPFMIDRTEVILGPGSVVYGSDAIGGVMNFFTKKPGFSFEDGLSLSGNAVARFATANEEKTGHVDINLASKDWAFLTSFSYSKFGDLKMGSNGPDDYLRPDYVETINGVDTVVTNDDPEVQVPTGYQQVNFMQKARFMPSANWDFNLGLFYTTTTDFPRYDRLIRKTDGEFRSAEWYYGPQRWLSANFEASHQQDGVAMFDDSKMNLSYQRFVESRNNRDFGEDVLYENDEAVDAFISGFDFTKKLGKTNIFYGLEYVYNKVSSEGWETNINTRARAKAASRYPDGSTWQSIAAYASLQTKFTEEVSFQGGLRYNHVILNASFEENNEFFDFPFSDADVNTGALTGSAGVTWSPNDVISWKLNFGTAFRAPNIDDVGKIFDSEPGSVVVPNPDVKSEYAYNGEIGAGVNIADGVVRFDVAAFYTVLEDALVRRDFSINGMTEIEYQGELSNVQAIQNAGRAEVWGFEVGVEVNFNENLQLVSQYNIVDGFTKEEDGSEVPVRHAAPPFGNTHLTWAKEKWKLDAFAVYNGQFDFEDLAPSQQNNAFLYATDENGNPFSPNWYTLNFGAQYQLTPEFRLTAVLENLTDQRYRTYSSGIAAPGMNLILSASYSF